jgi:hypothetical protein
MKSATITNIEAARRMNADEFAKARAEIARVHGTNGKEAAAKYEQELARLFEHSRWTQEELAKAEGKSESRIGYLLRFGRFLEKTSSGGFLADLTERRFRSYWEKTAREGEDKNADELRRFAEVAKLAAQPPEPKQPRATVGWATAVTAYLIGVRGPFSGKTLLNKKAEIEILLGRRIASNLVPDGDDVRAIAAIVQTMHDRKNLERASAEVAAEATTLSETARAKFDRLVNREIELNRAQFKSQVEEAARKRAEELSADMCRFYKLGKEEADQAKVEYKRLSKKLPQIMTQEEFKLVRSCLHSDRQSAAERARYDKAFEIFNRIAQSVAWEEK